MPKDPNEIGALWTKTSSHGEYMTGTVNGQPVVCFKNNSENSKAPAWRVLKVTPRASDATPPTAHDSRPAVVDDDPLGF
jgi:hypothetical protein